MTYKNLFTKDYIVVITGNTETNPERSDAKINVKSIQLASEINEENLVKSLKIEMTPLEVSEGKYQVIQHMIEQYPGNCSVIFNFNDIEEQMNVTMVSKYGVNFGLEVEKMLEDMNLSFTPMIDERWQ